MSSGLLPRTAPSSSDGSSGFFSNLTVDNLIVTSNAVINNLTVSGAIIFSGILKAAAGIWSDVYSNYTAGSTVTLQTRSANANVLLSPNGSGSVVVKAASALTADSLSPTTAGALTISTSANGNLSLSPNGTGVVAVAAAKTLTTDVINATTANGTIAIYPGGTGNVSISTNAGSTVFVTSNLSVDNGASSPDVTCSTVTNKRRKIVLSLNSSNDYQFVGLGTASNTDLRVQTGSTSGTLRIYQATSSSAEQEVVALGYDTSAAVNAVRIRAVPRPLLILGDDSAITGPLLARAGASAEYFSNATSGSMCVRNASAGPLLLGTGTGAAQIIIASSGGVPTLTQGASSTGAVLIDNSGSYDLRLSGTTDKRRKILLFEAFTNDYQFVGFGTASGTDLRVQMPSVLGATRFYQATGSGSEQEITAIGYDSGAGANAIRIRDLPRALLIVGSDTGGNGGIISRSASTSEIFTNSVAGDMCIRNYSVGAVLIGTAAGTAQITIPVSGGVPAFAVGLTMATSGGTAATLNYYETNTTSTSFSGPWASPVVVDVRYYRFGNVCTVQIPGLSGTATAAAAIVSPAIPSRFRPGSSAPDIAQAVFAFDVSTGTNGFILYDSANTRWKIFPTAAAAATGGGFTGSGSANMAATSFSYTV